MLCGSSSRTLTCLTLSMSTVVSFLSMKERRKQSSVQERIPHGAIGWSALCDCGISWSYSLAFELSYPQIILQQKLFCKR